MLCQVFTLLWYAAMEYGFEEGPEYEEDESDYEADYEELEFLDGPRGEFADWEPAGKWVNDYSMRLSRYLPPALLFGSHCSV
jgi:hypothetical protein